MKIWKEVFLYPECPDFVDDDPEEIVDPEDYCLENPFCRKVSDGILGEELKDLILEAEEELQEKIRDEIIELEDLEDLPEEEIDEKVERSEYNANYDFLERVVSSLGYEERTLDELSEGTYIGIIWYPFGCYEFIIEPED
jgi:hypothetical protein